MDDLKASVASRDQGFMDHTPLANGVESKNTCNISF